MNTLFTLSLARTRDLLDARSRLRQICRLFGFDMLEQARITCAAFELACREQDNHPHARLSIALDGTLLRVWFHDLSTPPTARPGKTDVQLAVNLPDAERLADEDVLWILDQVDQLHQPDMLAEVRHHNQDLLCVLTLLQQEERDVTLPVTMPRVAA